MIEVLSTGEKISDIKRAAKTAKRDSGLTHTQALDAQAEMRGFSSWEKLHSSAWTLDEDGDIRGQVDYPNSSVPIAVIASPLDMDEHHEQMSVKVEIERFTGSDDYYLNVFFVETGSGTDFNPDSRLLEKINAASESESLSDIAAATGAVVENIMTWFQPEWVDGLTRLRTH